MSSSSSRRSIPWEPNSEMERQRLRGGGSVIDDESDDFESVWTAPMLPLRRDTELRLPPSMLLMGLRLVDSPQERMSESGREALRRRPFAVPSIRDQKGVGDFLTSIASISGIGELTLLRIGSCLVDWECGPNLAESNILLIRSFHCSALSVSGSWSLFETEALILRPPFVSFGLAELLKSALETLLALCIQLLKLFFTVFTACAVLLLLSRCNPELLNRCESSTRSSLFSVLLLTSVVV